MVRTSFSSVPFALASVLVLVACGGSVEPDQGHGTLILRADVSGTAVATLVAEVTAADIPTPLTFNIPITAGIASGTITIPAGSSRTIAFRAYDAGGVQTHSGSVTASIQPGTNAQVTITLTPLTGGLPIVVTLGSFTVTVTPPSATVGIGGTVQLSVSITDWNGAPTTGTVSWATKDPGVATVDVSGLVTGAGLGNTHIAATFQGASGIASLGVTP